LQQDLDWHYRHFVKLKTKREVNAINFMNGYNSIHEINNIFDYILEFSNFSGIKYAFKFKISIYQCDI